MITLPSFFGALGVTPVQVFNNAAVAFELFCASALFAAPGYDRSRGLRIPLACGACLVLLGALLAVTRYVTLGAGFGASVGNFLAMFLLLCGSVRIAFARDLKQTLELSICGYAVQHVAAAIQEVVILALGVLAPETAAAWAPVEVLRIIVYVFVYLAVWHALIQGLDLTQGRGFPLPALVFLVASTLFITLVVSSYAYIVDLTFETSLLIRLASFLTCLVILVVFCEMARNQRLSDEVAFLEAMGDLRAQHYEALRDTIETTNIHYHDLKYEIQALRQGMENFSQGESQAVLAEIARDIDDYADLAKTGNSALDVVLSQKSSECRAAGISFTHMVDVGCLDWLGAHDVYSLFGNVLDNAIEASRRVGDPTRRVIKLCATRTADTVCIEVSNYYDDLRLTDDGQLTTTKADRRSHGFGMRSIRLIAEKNGGSATFSADDGIFDLVIQLRPPE